MSDLKPDDPRLKPIRPEEFDFTPIPQPKDASSIVSVSLLPTGKLTLPREIVADAKSHDETIELPSWSFLVEKDGKALLWDLGIRADPENSPQKLLDGALKKFKVTPGPGPIKRLQEGSYDLAKLDLLILSHQHFDHYGDFETLPKHTSVILGYQSLESIGPGAPEDPNALWPKKWLEETHILELPSMTEGDVWSGEIASIGSHGKFSERKWEKVACYGQGVDWFGDGSFWLLANEGHTVGHLNALARVTADPPTYLLLGGDTSHHQSLYLPVPTQGAPDRRSRIPFYPSPNDPSKMTALDDDPVENTVSISRLTRMSAEDNVMVLLAHEGQVENVLPEWPETLDNWKTNGLKRQKEMDPES